MPAVSSTSPVKFDTAGTPNDRLAVTFLDANRSSGTVYYKSTPDVSSSSNDGSLAPGQSVTLDRTSKWFIAAPLSGGGPASAQVVSSVPLEEQHVGGLFRLVGSTLQVSTDHGATWTDVDDPASPASYNVQQFGALANGAPANAKSISGTDASAAFQAAVDAAYAAGGGLVYVPPGTYRISNTVHVKRGVTVMGPAGSNGGAPRNGAQTDGEPWWDSIGRKFTVPQSALPTILQDGNVTCFAMDSPGTLLANLAFLNPKQLLPDEYDNAGARGTEPTHFAPTITTSGANGIHLKNLVDYNSWDFINTLAQSGFVCEDIWSQSHNRIIYGTPNEFYMRRIHYNSGTVFYTGRNTHQGWVADQYLIDIDHGGPSFLDTVSLVGADYGFRDKTNWGITASNIWLDQVFVEGIKLEHTVNGVTSDRTVLHKFTNVEIGPGNSAGFHADLPWGQQTSGSNPAEVLLSNSIINKMTLRGDFVFKGTGTVFNGAFSTEGTNVSEPLAVQLTGCSLPGGTPRFTNVAGTTLVTLAGCKRHQAPGDDTITAGDLWVVDHDRMLTETIEIPVGTVLAAGDNTVGELFIPADRLSAQPQVTIWHVEGMAINGDSWKLGGTSGLAGAVILAPLYNTLHVSAAEQVPQAAINQAQPMAKTGVVPIAKAKMPASGGLGGSVSVTKGYRVPIVYHSVAGYTVLVGDFPYGIKLRVSYCSTP